jgi:ribosomal protein S18 acetylase RimI-like enzyme
MKAEFNALTAGTMERALRMMGCLYSEAGAAHHRERARRAAEGLMANPELGGVWLIHVSDERVSDERANGERANGERANGEPVGYLCVTLCYSLEFDGRFALLDELYLEEASRGKGIGAQAIAFAAEFGRARGLTAIRLEVAHTNSHAVELYRREGFKAHDRHLMTKWL